MAFGKSFHTRAEARKEIERLKARGEFIDGVNGHCIRKMPKKNFPRRKKLYHVGSYIDYLNFV